LWQCAHGNIDDIACVASPYRAISEVDLQSCGQIDLSGTPHFDGQELRTLALLQPDNSTEKRRRAVERLVAGPEMRHCPTHRTAMRLYRLGGSGRRRRK
jgi:hypothetical protein